jgi:PPOX class probable F420-dependent enzyme
VVFDTGSDTDTHALERLATDMIGWLTTVRADGQPQTFPIWFLWDGAEILVYSDRRAKRNENIATNPRVSFHLGDDGRGSDIVIVDGEARIDAETPAPEANEAYNAKYGEWIRDSFSTAEEFTSVYNVPFRIRPVRGRAFG